MPTTPRLTSTATPIRGGGGAASTFTPGSSARFGSASASAAATPPSSTRGTGAGVGASSAGKRNSCLEQIQLLQRRREERRRSMEERRAERAAEEKRLVDLGMPGDVDFQRMIRAFREEHGLRPHPHVPPGDLKICICVRKRPINEKERRRKDYDAVTCFNPVVMVHDCKLRVDGITKYLDNTDFAFDHAFDETETTEALYHYTAAPLVPFIFQAGRATCFAYGQTGSGKTYTMTGIQRQAVKDIFAQLEARDSQGPELSVLVSYFEIYGGRCQDLLNDRHRLIVREDGRGDVVVAELEEKEAGTAEELLAFIEQGNRNRTTKATEVNDVSSRSHAICQIVLRARESGKMFGKLSLVDLAGSERGADTKSHDRERRLESAEINKSLLALKECIRALDSDSAHVPYRASKLTLVLKDCFAREKARTVMIATVSPNASSADHTLNTLRYADRVKEKNAGSYSTPLTGGRRGDFLEGEFDGEGEELLLDDEEEDGGLLDEDGWMDAEGEGMEGQEQGEEGEGDDDTPAAELEEVVTAPPPHPQPQQPQPQRRASTSSVGGGVRQPFSRSSSRGLAVKATTATSSSSPASGRSGSSSASSSGSSSSTRLAPSAALKARSSSTTSTSKPAAASSSSSPTKAPSAAASAGTKKRPPPLGGRKIPSNDEVDVDHVGEEEDGGVTAGVEGLSVSDGEGVGASYEEEEEALLNLHMNVIQENAELLTEEGNLLQRIQQGEEDGEGEVDVRHMSDYDLDAYTVRLEEILARKLELIGGLREQLRGFRARRLGQGQQRR